MLLRKKKMLGWKHDDSQEKNLPYDSEYGKGPFKPNLQ
jgi:hypothetical protein